MRVDKPSVDRKSVLQRRRERVLGRQPIVNGWPYAGEIGVNDDSKKRPCKGSVPRTLMPASLENLEVRPRCVAVESMQ